MTDQATGSNGATPPTSAPNGGARPPTVGNPVTAPANPPPDFFNPQPNPPSAGFSPAMRDRERMAAAQQTLPLSDNREGAPQQAEGQQPQPPAASRTVDIDGVQWSHEQIRSAIAHQVEAETQKAALPQSPADYQVALPADWTPPIDGVRFEFDKNDPLLARAQELAHARGIGQSAFSDMLGVYAANRISELQRVNAARSAELGKLGSAATQRIDGIARWLQAYAGADAAVMINQLRQYPVSSMVSMWERVIRTFSDQGGATAPSGGRAEPDMSGRIPGYENMSYSQRRAAQDQINARRGGR